MPQNLILQAPGDPVVYIRSHGLTKTQYVDKNARSKLFDLAPVLPRTESKHVRILISFVVVSKNPVGQPLVFCQPT